MSTPRRFGKSWTPPLAEYCRSGPLGWRFIALLAAARSGVTGDRRTATRDGLACTLFHVGQGIGVLAAPTWRVLTPGRVPVFHLPGVHAQLPAVATIPDLDSRPRLLVVEGAA